MILPNEFRIIRKVKENEAVVYLYYYSKKSNKDENFYRKNLKNMDENKCAKLESLLGEIIAINNDKTIPLKFGILDLQYIVENFE